MKVPPEYMQPLMHSIEESVIEVYEEMPKLADVDVEWAYQKLIIYYKAIASGKNVEEPLARSEKKQAVVDEILNRLDLREQLKADESIINNPNYTYGEKMYTSLAMLYLRAFKRLEDSAKFWRKQNGRTGYLDYTSRFLRPS